MVEFGLNWMVIFRKEGTNVEEMTSYFEEHETKVVGTVFDKATVTNLRTGEDSDTEIVAFALSSPGKIFVPMDIRFELGLKEIQPFVYAAYERD